MLVSTLDPVTLAVPAFFAGGGDTYCIKYLEIASDEPLSGHLAVDLDLETITVSSLLDAVDTDVDVTCTALSDAGVDAPCTALLDAVDTGVDAICTALSNAVDTGVDATCTALSDAVDTGVDVTCTALSDVVDTGVDTQEYMLHVTWGDNPGVTREGVNPGITLTVPPDLGVETVDMLVVSYESSDDHDAASSISDEVLVTLCDTLSF